MVTHPLRRLHKAESLFRHKVLGLLQDRELITPEGQDRIDLLLSWRNSGFGVHNRTTVYSSDTEGLHKLACYFMRPPVNLSRLRYHPDSKLLLYEPKSGQPIDDDDPLVDPASFWPASSFISPSPTGTSSASTVSAPTGFGKPTGRGTSLGQGPRVKRLSRLPGAL